jgi:hypothetical protein
MKAVALLKKYHACKESIEWAGEMSVKEAWLACERGDWMLWIYSRLYPENKVQLTTAKAFCAATVKHLMKDKRSIDAVHAAMTGEISKNKRNAAADAANAAYTAYADAANAAYTAYAAAAYAAYTAYTAAAVAADAYAADDAADARLKNRKLTASICRQLLYIGE